MIAQPTRDQIRDVFLHHGFTVKEGQSDLKEYVYDAAYALLALAAKQAGAPFQQRVQPWMLACFGEAIAADREERNHRFLEEALELVQATGCTAGEAHQLVDYVFARPVGEPAQEVGGVMVTLAALCLAQGLDMHDAGEVELARIWTKVEAIRAKQAAKPKHSPLPMAAAPAPAAAQADAPTVQRMAEVLNAMLEANTTQEYQDAADDAKALVARVVTQGQKGAAAPGGGTSVPDPFPMQPIHRTDSGVIRFRRNRIVDDIYEFARPRGLGLNELAVRDYTPEERMQFAQLIGYSLSGYGELSYVSDDSLAQAESAAVTLTAQEQKGGAA